MILFVFAFGLCFMALVIPTKAQGTTLNPTDDVSINQSLPDKNNNEYTDMLVGESTGWHEILVLFQLATKPLEFTKAELWFEVIDFGGPTTLHFYECDNFWLEDNVTWNTAPPAESYVGNISINKIGLHKLDITPFIGTQVIVPPWSVRINCTELTWVRIACKETAAAYSSNQIPPQIRFDYQEPLIGVDLSLFTILSIIVGSIGIVRLNRRAKKSY